jgi:hypothetical protein
MSLFPLDGALDWNLTSREQLTAGELGYISPRIYTVNSPNLIVGAGITVGRPTWKWAGRIIQIIPAKPSTTGIFSAGIEVARWSLYLNKYQHFKLGNYSPRPYQIRLEPAKWLADLTIEMWWYDGEPENTSVTDRLDTIEQSISSSTTSITQQLNQIEIQINQS